MLLCGMNVLHKYVEVIFRTGIFLVTENFGLLLFSNVQSNDIFSYSLKVFFGKFVFKCFLVIFEKGIGQIGYF